MFNGKICVQCGKNNVIADFLCNECYLKEHPLIESEKSVEIDACKQCGAVELAHQWYTDAFEDSTHDILKKAVARKILKSWKFTVRPIQVTVKTLDIIQYPAELRPSSLHFSIIIQSSSPLIPPELFESRELSAKIHWITCPSCINDKSAKYESKLQIRNYNEMDRHLTTKDIVDFVLNSLRSISSNDEPHKVIVEVKEVKNGVDFLFRNRNVAPQIITYFEQEYPVLVKQTTEFMGFDKSKTKPYPGRNVVLVSFPPYKKGDLVQYDHQIYQILEFRGKKVILWSFDQNQPQTFFSSILWNKKFKRLAHYEESTRFQIINEEKGDILQIMDLDTFNYYYLPKNWVPDKTTDNAFSGFLWKKNVFPSHLS